MGWEEQSAIFAACGLCGVLIGIGADGYRAWQSAVHLRRRSIILLDCLLWCVLAVLVCSLMLTLNGGDMRSYVFLALMVGYLIYRRLAGTRIVRLWLWCAKAVRTVWRIARRILAAICLPLGWCLSMASSLVRIIIRQMPKIRKSPPEQKS